ncbi:hypothetical protein F2Q69_00006455 [Brassica cretica]|uniref:Uncharacterized protein n=1 Tax=Brassica cretica TaxID=69181 RepID=A0A8S9PH13_BRACR|nr:hypothetical protein F2Q69_00006455 [Brassica cretica]
MPSSFCFGEEWLLFTHHLSPSLAELISSFSYPSSLRPSIGKPHLTTIALRRYLNSLSTHFTKEIPQLTLQESHTRSLLSSFLLPSTSAGSLHDQLAMVLSSYGLIQSFPTEDHGLNRCSNTSSFAHTSPHLLGLFYRAGLVCPPFTGLHAILKG